jgi:hypothetical protein
MPIYCWQRERNLIGISIARYPLPCPTNTAQLPPETLLNSSNPPKKQADDTRRFLFDLFTHIDSLMTAYICFALVSSIRNTLKLNKMRKIRMAQAQKEQKFIF